MDGLSLPEQALLKQLLKDYGGPALPDAPRAPSPSRWAVVDRVDQSENASLEGLEQGQYSPLEAGSPPKELRDSAEEVEQILQEFEEQSRVLEESLAFPGTEDPGAPSPGVCGGACCPCSCGVYLPAHSRVSHCGLSGAEGRPSSTSSQPGVSLGSGQHQLQALREQLRQSQALSAVLAREFSMAELPALHQEPSFAIMARGPGVLEGGGGARASCAGEKQ